MPGKNLDFVLGSRGPSTVTWGRHRAMKSVQDNAIKCTRNHAFQRYQWAWIFQVIHSFVCPRLQYCKSAQLVEFLQNIWKREEPNILGSDLVRVETRRALTDIQHIVCKKYRQGKAISRALRISRVEWESLKWGWRLWRLRATKLQTKPMTDHAFCENSEKLDTFHFNDTTQTVTGKK